jgi:hypothetical protein
VFFISIAWLASRGGTATTFSIGEKSGLSSVRDPAGEKIAQGKDGACGPHSMSLWRTGKKTRREHENAQDYLD